MKASPKAMAAMLAAGQALATANGVSALPVGGAAAVNGNDAATAFVLPVQGTERLDRLWQHRSIIEHALQAPPEARAETPPPLPSARPPLPEPELSAIPQEPETAPAQEQLAEASEEGVSCEEAASIVGDYGFSEIRPIACSGEVYRFSASRDGTAYSVGIAPAAGEITEVSRE
jgi:hypothetical protein